jgi:predicted nucleic acid-binding protein
VAEAAWLLDTSILVDVLRGYKPARDWIASIPQSARFVSVITAAELLSGCRNQTEQRAIDRELTLYQTTWVDEAISQAALQMYRRFHLSHGVEFLDCLSAATATERNVQIATLNLKHFAPLPDLSVKKPY